MENDDFQVYKTYASKTWYISCLHIKELWVLYLAYNLATDNIMADHYRIKSIKNRKLKFEGEK